MKVEYRRILAMQRVLEGYTLEEVAEFLGVDASSIERWRMQFQKGGWSALTSRRVARRPPFDLHTSSSISR